MSLAERALQDRRERFGLLPSVWKLLRLRARIAINVFKHSKTRSKVWRIVVLVLAAAFMGFLYWVSTLMLRALQMPQVAGLFDPALIAAALPPLVLGLAFLLTLMTNFGVLLQALYLSRDMDFLIVSPLPMRAVFLAKLLEAILPNFVLFCAISLPVLFGLGSSSGYSFLYYPLLVILLALLALAAGGLAGVLVMAVVRFVPARRVAEVLGFLGATFSVLIGQSGQLFNYVELEPGEVANLAAAFTRLNPPWSPFTWAGRGLTAIGMGDWLPGIGLTVLVLALAGGMFAGTLLLAEHLYYTGWSSMQGTARRKRPTAPRLPAEVVVDHPAGRWLPRPLRGIVRKDFHLLRRDPRNYSNLITPLIVGFVLLFTTSTRDPEGAGRRLEALSERFNLGFLDSVSLVFLAVFVGWMVLANLGPTAFSREGRSYWMLKSAPIKTVYLLAGKFLVTFLPALLFSLLYLVLAFVIRRANWAWFPYSAGALAFVLGGASGIAVAFGAAGANLEWDAPHHQRMRGSAGCLVFLAVSAFVGLDLALFIAPLGIWQFSQGSLPPLAFLISIVLGGGAAAAAALIALSIAEPRVARIGETGE